MTTWCWLVAILGAGVRLVDFDRPILRQANEGVLPFYVLHQTVIVVLAFFLLDWHVPVVLKYPVLAATSLLVIVISYLGAIRPFSTVRLLFGMSRSKPGV